MTQSSESIPEAYRARFRRVLEHIDAHLAEPLSVERLSRVAAFSKYHFHRQFSALFGLGVHEYVQLLRLQRASDDLGSHSWRSVIQVALDSGYESPEAFARVFKKHLGLTPSQFQALPDWQGRDALRRAVQTIRSEYMKPNYQPSDVKIVDFPETHVAAFEHRGPPERVSESVRRFIEWRRAQPGLRPAESATFNIFWDNPATTPPDDYHMDLCVSTKRDVPSNELGIITKTIPAGRCAVLRHVGPSGPLDDTFHYLYLNWLPSSGETPRDYPPFAQRVAFPPAVPEHESIVDLYLPLL
ncbi:MAG: AraC family transcriptional regulator [Polyangiales bacterium]